MARSDCKSFVRAEPIFHSKFCIKSHAHHTKLLCSWGGTAGGGGGGVGYANAYNPGIYASAYPTGVTFSPASGFSGATSDTGSFIGHEHHEHPTHQVPGPIAGTGVAGLIAAAIVVVVLARKRRAKA